MSICVVTSIIDIPGSEGEKYSDLISPCTESKISYCNKHGYDLLINRLWIHPEKHPSWNKLLTLKNCMSKKYDYLFWMDADTLITNPEIKLETILDQCNSKYDLHFTRDAHNGPFNCGVFFMRVDEYVCDLFEACLKLWEQYQDCQWEQSALVRMYNNNECGLKERLQIIDEQRLFNSFCCSTPQMICWQPGDFLIHFAGIRGDSLKMNISRVLDLIK